MKVATIPIGYADGFRRTFSNGWEVLIDGKRAKIIGKVCMDSFMVDVTDIPDVKVGDDVYIWDNKEIKLEDLSDKCDTINYEIISQVGERVPRKFI
jgi:alanine racemase